MMHRIISMFSGGGCSWAATKRHTATHGRDGLILLFADTLIEDEDTYRFVIEGAADIFGLAGGAIDDLKRRALAVPAVEDDCWEERCRQLAGLRDAAMRAIPGLVWIADGRSPWQTFVDRKFIGNNRVDPCSELLKRKLMDAWRDGHCEKGATTLVFGLDWSERGRIEGKTVKGEWKPGHRQRMIAAGWQPTYPMDEKPYLTKDEILAWIRSEGIAVPRLYDLGFAHGNCGGYCCKMGLGQASHLLDVMPKRFAWHEQEERKAREAIGPSAIPALRFRSDGRSRRLTMEDFRRLKQEQGLLFDSHGWGCGGGCAIDGGES